VKLAVMCWSGRSWTVKCGLPARNVGIYFRLAQLLLVALSAREARDETRILPWWINKTSCKVQDSLRLEV